MRLGPSFGEFISSEKLVRHRQKDWVPPRVRSHFLLLLFLLSFLVILISLGKLQLVEGADYRRLSDGNRVRESVIHAPRGIIYDRNRTPLVFNVPGFRVLEKEGKVRPISREEGLRLLSGGATDTVTVDSLRQYVSPQAFSHVLGFIGEVSMDELSTLEGEYRGGDLVGKDGIEKSYESLLRGVDGKELFEVESSGARVRTLGKIDPIPGNDLVLSIDKRLSEAAFTAMAGVEKGALIVSNPKTGEILALVSKPSFDANLFTLGSDYRPATTSAYPTVEAILTHDDRPLFNRTISGVYPPGSTFKIITAAAGLENGKITAETEIEDIGVIRIGAFSFPNWYFLQYGGKEGQVDVIKGLKRSNDIFFYKVAEFVGLDALGEMAGNFGVGKLLGIDLVGEAEGLFPTDAWKREAIGEQWFLGDTYHLGIGQGYLLTTPLQVNFLTDVIASSGKLCQPTLVKSEKCRVKEQNFLKAETLSLIKEGMKEACAPGGTGWPLFDFKVKNENIITDDKNFFAVPVSTSSGELSEWVHIPVACKTGTAEFGDPKDLTHAWFTAYAPIEDPQIVVTVLVEAGGEGSNVAAPIAKKIFEEWFGR